VVRSDYPASVRRAGWSLVALALGLGSVFIRQDALAEEGTIPAPAHRLVVITPKGNTGVAPEALISALESQLAELGVFIELSERSLYEGPEISLSDEKVLAYVWIVREAEMLSVHFLEASDESLRQRRLPLASADSASEEEVAVVVRSAVTALLDRMNQPEDEPPQPPEIAGEQLLPERVAATRTEPGPLLFSLGWSGQSYAPGLEFAHSAVGDVAVRPMSTVLVTGLSYSFLAAQEHSSDGITLSLRRHPIEVYGGVDTRTLHRPLFVLAHTGLMLDLVRRRTIETDTHLLIEPSEIRPSWALAFRGGVGVEMNSNLSFVVLCAMDVLLSRVPVGIDVGNSEQTILEPYWVRPRLAAQVSWQLP
jgi:hypothetical protein